MARRLAPASRWGLGSRSEPGLWLAPGLWSESGLLPERRLEPEWMRTSGPGPRRLGMNSSPGRNRPIGSSGRRRARNTVVSTWQWCYSSDWAVSHQLDNTDARSVILAGTAGCGGQYTYFSSHQLLRNRQVVLSLRPSGRRWPRSPFRCGAFSGWPSRALDARGINPPWLKCP